MGSVGFGHCCGETREGIARRSSVCKMGKCCVGFYPRFSEADEIRVAGVNDVCKMKEVTGVED